MTTVEGTFIQPYLDARCGNMDDEDILGETDHRRFQFDHHIPYHHGGRYHTKMPKPVQIAQVQACQKIDSEEENASKF